MLAPISFLVEADRLLPLALRQLLGHPLDLRLQLLDMPRHLHQRDVLGRCAQLVVLDLVAVLVFVLHLFPEILLGRLDHAEVL